MAKGKSGRPPKSEIGWLGRFSSKEEKDTAKSLRKKYLEDFVVDTTADENTLSELIYFEVIQTRLQNKLNDYYTKDAKAIPQDMVKLLQDNSKMITALKSQLGVNTPKDMATYDALEHLKTRHKKWREENQASRHLKCVVGNTKVTMFDFSVKDIKDIKVGDEIIGIEVTKKSGLKLVKQKVLAHYDQGEKEVVKLTTIKGHELTCTSDHPIFSHYRAQNNTRTGQAYLPAENCLRRYVKIINYIENDDDYLKGVLIGFIESDGWISKNKDRNHPNWNFSKSYHICQSAKKELKAILNILEKFNITYSKKFNDGGWGDGAFEIYIKTENNSFIDKIYDDLFKNKDVGMGFLAGFALGDGHVDSLGNVSIAQKNKKDLLEKIFSHYKFKYTPCKNRFGNKLDTYSLGKQIILNVPYSAKTEKFQKRIFSSGNHHPLDRINKVELLDGKYRVYDITTETSNFIANGFIVHNCPHCFQLIWLKIRTAAWEAHKHPFFKDTFLYNDPLFRNVGKEILIDRVFLAEVFGVSPDYIDFVIEKRRDPKKEIENLVDTVQTEDITNKSPEISAIETVEASNVLVAIEEANKVQTNVVEIEESNAA